MLLASTKSFICLKKLLSYVAFITLEHRVGFYGKKANSFELIKLLQQFLNQSCGKTLVHRHQDGVVVLVQILF